MKKIYTLLISCFFTLSLIAQDEAIINTISYNGLTIGAEQQLTVIPEIPSLVANTTTGCMEQPLSEGYFQTGGIVEFGQSFTACEDANLLSFKFYIDQTSEVGPVEFRIRDGADQADEAGLYAFTSPILYEETIEIVHGENEVVLSTPVAILAGETNVFTIQGDYSISPIRFHGIYGDPYSNGSFVINYIFNHWTSYDWKFSIATEALETEVICPTEDVVLTTQAEVDAFPVMYPGCTDLEVNLTINSGKTSDITELSPLSQITTIDGNLTVQSCFGLTDLSGLENLETVSGKIKVSGNKNMMNLEGLTSLSSTGQLNIIGNKNLMSLTGLNALTAVENNLQIERNQSLTSLTGLESLETVGFLFRIQTNPSLMNLNGLSSLQSVNQLMSVKDNSSLESLEGLGFAGTIFRNLLIKNNMVLSDCAVNSVCEHIEVSNETMVFGNATGCNTVFEIQYECMPVAEKNILVKEVDVYPNPATSILYLEKVEYINENTEIKILDSFGNTVKVVDLSGSISDRIAVDVNELDDGVYVLVIQDGKQIIRSSFVKM